MVNKQKWRMLNGRIKYSTKVWYPDHRCFNDSAVDVKGSVYIEKPDLNREEKYYNNAQLK